MKLKYYLRGLGIGMIVTALILGISFSDREGQDAQTLTDDQIRERALELGMVDSSELTLAALQNNVRQTAEPEATEEPAVTETPASTEEVTETSEPEPSAETETSEEPGVTEEPAMAEEKAASQEAETTPESGTLQTVRITVNKGASSDSVSRQLQEAGLVEDARAFDNYLCNNGYSRSISTGTYEIEPGTSEEEIAKIITRKH